jgi:hypothetical protein
VAVLLPRRSLHALPRPAGIAWLLEGVGLPVVEDGQRPASSGQFPGDGKFDDDGFLVAGQQILPALVEAVVASVAVGSGGQRRLTFAGRGRCVNVVRTASGG